MDWTMLAGDCCCSTVLLSVAALLGLVYFLKSRKPNNFPPGPRGLPIVGYLPFLGNNPGETLRKMKLKYGPVISLKMGMDDWVILNDYETINEALVKQGEKFSGRPSNCVFEILSEGCSLVMLDYGPMLKNLRKFGQKTLRGFGVGKQGMEENVEEELPHLIDNLLKEDNGSPATKLTLAVSNIICRVVFGSRFTYGDKRFTELIKILQEFFSESSSDAKLFGLMTMAPALRHIPPFRWALKRILADKHRFLGILREIVEEHRKNFDENDIRDFIDAFLLEIKKKGESDPSFCEKQLLQYIRDLFEAGTETTSATLTWAMLCFVTYPECQEKISNEVQEVLGESGTPTMKHRDDMPYTCAFLQELMRHRSLLPLSVFHKTNAEATLCGYTIPKNTTISPNLWSVHMDPKFFENPKVFRPERFLDEDGKFVKSNHVIPFSIGPRHCLGEQLARMEVFIFLTGIIQKLKVLPDPVNPPPSFETSNMPNMFTMEAPSFNVVFKKR